MMGFDPLLSALIERYAHRGTVSWVATKSLNITGAGWLLYIVSSGTPTINVTIDGVSPAAPIGPGYQYGLGGVWSQTVSSGYYPPDGIHLELDIPFDTSLSITADQTITVGYITGA